MTTAPNDATAAIAARTRTRTAAVPRVKFSGRGFSIDHPEPKAGARLMTEALGAPDSDAMHGLLRQLVKASVSGQKPDRTDLAFMLSMVQSIAPRDSIEAMLVAQMVSVHVMAMRCAYRLANASDLVQQDSAARALGRLARTFPAQIEALNRYRSKDEAAITVRNLSVQDGGKAIVGNVTQHARVVVAQPGAAGASTDAVIAPAREAGEREHDRVDTAGATQA
jgi:hypothetical protein